LVGAEAVFDRYTEVGFSVGVETDCDR
jgi:hypothetical protein